MVPGRLQQADADTLEFSIEGLGVVATFHPTTNPLQLCA